MKSRQTTASRVLDSKVAARTLPIARMRNAVRSVLEDLEDRTLLSLASPLTATDLSRASQVAISPTSPSVSNPIHDGSFHPASSRIFYVNDTTISPGDYTTAPGDDHNDGLTPAKPKATIQNVLSSYTLNPGDTIKVDNGNYTELTTINLPAADSGITIQGFTDPSAPSKATVLTRNNTTSNQYVFQLTGAANITIDHIQMVGGYDGIYAATGAGSTGLKLSNSSISGAGNAGVDLENSNDLPDFESNNIQGQSYGLMLRVGNAKVIANSVHDNSSEGIGIYGDSGLIRNNTVYSNGYDGIGIISNSVTVDGNLVYSNHTIGISRGIYAGGGDSQGTISNNTVHDNGSGIETIGMVSVIGNTVYANSNGFGISVGDGATARNNIVYNNLTGIYAANNSQVLNNQVYNNAGDGIYGNTQYFDGWNYSVGLAVVNGNIVHDNAVGIVVTYGSFQLENNLLYSNTNQGILLNSFNQSAIENNTVYQPTGDAVSIVNTTSVNLTNNILWSQAGHDISLDIASERGFQSDYNDLFVSGSGKIASWEGHDFLTRFDWTSEVGQDLHSFQADPSFVDVNSANFHLLAGSPAIDRGDIAAPYSNEPTPNGGRVNVGSDGNTPQANPSPATQVQILSPNGFEKYAQGQAVNIQWLTYGVNTTLPTKLEYSSNNGATWTQITASALTDATGRGNYTWTVPQAATVGSSYRVRATVTGASQDQSDSAFQVAPQGAVYFINDGSTVGDQYTTAVGNNANNGKSASQPMASLEGLLASYTMHAGDTIYVDPGNYRLYHTIILGLQQSGIHIQGPTQGGVALFDRGSNKLADHDQDAIALTGGTNVTIDHLNITGGYEGIYAPSGAASTGFRLTNSSVFENSDTGIDLQQSNDSPDFEGDNVYGQATGIFLGVNHATVASSSIYNNNTDGIEIDGDQVAVRGNSVYSNDFGIYCYQQGNEAIVDGNMIYSNRETGIFGSVAAGTTTNQAIISNNIVHGNGSGINIGGDVSVTQNTVDGDLNGFGIYIYDNAIAQGNIVHDNLNGIIAGYNSQVLNNRVYNNTESGIYADVNHPDGFSYALGSAVVNGNIVYNNATGIDLYFNGQYVNYPQYGSYQAENNLVYSNSNDGILVNSVVANGQTTIENNTVYQPVGDAVSVVNTTGVTLANNILWTQAGHDISVDPSSESGFLSDHNDLYTTGAGKVGLWEGSDLVTLSNWQATGQDLDSIASDPKFVDIDGADNVLGSTGGLDDNFSLSVGSPAIDKIDPTTAPTTDILNNPRVDDPGTTNRAGIADLGAYEFQGSSGSTSPLTIVATTPSQIGSSSTTNDSLNVITVSFSGAVSQADVLSPANYRLIYAGPNNIIGTNDDVAYGLNPVGYDSTSHVVSLSPTIPGSLLPVGKYQLVVSGSAGNAIHDLSGKLLDGDRNGTAGGDYKRTFQVTPNVSLLPFTADGGSNGILQYEVDHGAPASPPSVGIYRSTSTTYSSSASLLATINLTASDLTPGIHAIGHGAKTFTLPSSVTTDTNTDDYLLAVVNPAGSAASTSVFSGIYHAPGGAVVISGTQASDAIQVFPGIAQVSLNGQTFTYAANDVTGIQVRAHGGDDVINVGSGVPVSLAVWGGDGNDILSTTAMNLNFDGGSGSNVINVGGTSGDDVFNIGAGSVALSGATVGYTSATLNLLGLDGNDTFKFGVGTSVSGSIDGGAGFNTIDESASTTPVALNLASSTITGVGGGFANVQGINGGSGANTLTGPASASVYNITGANSGNVAGVIFAKFGTLIGGANDDAFKFSNAATLSGGLNGGAGANTVDLSAYTTSTGVNLASSRFSGLGGSFSSIQTFLGGGNTANQVLGQNPASTYNITAANTFNVGGLNFSGFRNITGGTGNDSFVFTAGATLLGNLNGGGGSNTMDLSAYTTAIGVNLPVSRVTGLGGSFSSIQSFLAGGHSGNQVAGPNASSVFNITAANSFNVSGVSFSGFKNISGGTGNDTFVLSDGAMLSGNLNGGGGTNTLDLSALTTATGVNLSTSRVTGLGGSFASIQSFLGGSSTGNQVAGPNAASSYNITAANAFNVGGLNFSGFRNLSGGTGNDSFVFTAGATLSGNLNGGGGTNTLDLSALTTATGVNLSTSRATGLGGSFSSIQSFLAGSNSGNQVVGPNTSSVFNITAANVFNIGGFNFTGFKNISGGTANNSFVFGNGGSISGSINGGVGRNWIDFGANTTGVTVNLATGKSTSIRGSISNIQDVRGGSGNDNLTGNGAGNVLIGGAGNDRLVGGSARSLLIGGTGIDSVSGTSFDDVVIGGSTTLDNNNDALDSILKEWQSASDSYAVRISYIKNGGGLNGTNALNLGSTVIDDLATNILTGGAGNDWFFKGTNDIITDLQPGEQVN